MKIFNCGNCGHAVFFENVQCLNCGCALAFLPDQLTMAALLAPATSNTDGTRALWERSHPPVGVPRQYRMCLNHNVHDSCNFAVLPQDPNLLCVSCRQTQRMPDLSFPGNRKRWYQIEVAKRRLFYTLARLGLAATDSADGSQDGPVYEFLADLPGSPRVMTGHNQGLITINISEADDAERERRRVELGEPYRTLLGHLRHESGHFYWDRLIREQHRIGAFRAAFGDESVDYRQALKTHYANDHSDNLWQADFVSAYATSHPWEDWAETWAHYLHMIDLLETAAAYHTSVEVPGSGPSVNDQVSNPFDSQVTDFDHLVQQWVPVTLMLNSLNRSLGQDDAYPFALSRGALRKLRFVHDVIHASVLKPLVDDADDMNKPADTRQPLVI